MATTALLTAYDAIKQLEAQNVLPFPLTSQTVHIGTFDASTGAFKFAIQTGYEEYGVRTGTGGGGGTTTSPTRGPGVPPIQPQVAIADPVSPFHYQELGYVIVYAMDLKLSFDVVNAGNSTFSVTINDQTQSIPTVATPVTSPVAPISPPILGPPVTVAPIAPPPPPIAPPPVHPVGPVSPVRGPGLPVLHPNAMTQSAVADAPAPDALIEGGPIENLLTMDLAQFSTLSTEPWEVPGTRVGLSSGSHSTSIQLRITRPPIATGGAITIPALPTAIIYAPPVGPAQKNSATYSSSTVVSNKIATTVSNSSSTKTSTAYSTPDFIDKITGFVNDLAGVATSFLPAPSAGSGSSSPGGAVGAVESAVGPFLSIFGINTGSSSGGPNAATDIKYLTSGAKALQDILDGLVSSNTQNTTQLSTTSTETDLTTTDTTTLTEGTDPGFGPGVGDRIGMLLNVRIAWAIINGEMNLTVLGYDGTRAYSVQTLGADLKLLQGGAALSKTQTNLDAATIQSLLALDPLIPTAAVPNPDAKVLLPPRFEVNIDDPSIGGDGTNTTSGDSFTVSHNITTADISTTTNVTTQVRDFKPGWMTALFGDNTATESQTSMTYSNGTTTTVGTTITSGISLVAPSGGGVNMIAIYFDNLFKTFVFLPYPQTD
jgi:hypothetical protein